MPSYYCIGHCLYQRHGPGYLLIQSLPQGTSNSPSYLKIVTALSFMDKDCHWASIVHYMSHPDLQLHSISDCCDI